MEVFHDAHDAYEAAVERGDTDREALMEARSEALVAFLAGPRPKNTVEAYQVIFAALQAVVDGNDFDLAWRSTVCPALSMLGVQGAGAAPALDSPCIAVCRDFIAKHIAMDASPEPDIPEPVSDAACEAWKRVKEQRPVTVAGFAAVLRSHVMWLGDGDFSHDDPDMNAMFRAVKGLCDLVGFDEGALVAPRSVPMAELQAIRTDYHVERYRSYLTELAAIAARPDDIADEASDVMFDAADDTFGDLEGGATTFACVMLKARAAHHWAMQRSQGSTMSPRVLAEFFGIIAADLEILTAGKAVQS
jgi:hypothetical protein